MQDYITLERNKVLDLEIQQSRPRMQYVCNKMVRLDNLNLGYSSCRDTSENEIQVVAVDRDY